MASYSVTLKSSAEKDLRKLDRKEVSRILSTIDSLADNPYPPASKKLVGSDNTYRIRVGNYRVVYIVVTRLRQIEIQIVRHRKDVYR